MRQHTTVMPLGGAGSPGGASGAASPGFGRPEEGSGPSSGVQGGLLQVSGIWTALNVEQKSTGGVLTHPKQYWNARLSTEE